MSEPNGHVDMVAHVFLKTPLPPCRTCGAPAIMAAIDTRRCEVPGAQWEESVPVGPVKYGCEAHPVQSIELPSVKYVELPRA